MTLFITCMFEVMLMLLTWTLRIGFCCSDNILYMNMLLIRSLHCMYITSICTWTKQQLVEQMNSLDDPPLYVPKPFFSASLECEGQMLSARPQCLPLWSVLLPVTFQVWTIFGWVQRGRLLKTELCAWNNIFYKILTKPHQSPDYMPPSKILFPSMCVHGFVQTIWKRCEETIFLKWHFLPQNQSSVTVALHYM